MEAKGIPAKSLNNVLKVLGLSRTAVSFILNRASIILKRASKATLAGSYQIWLERDKHEQ